ncbi:MAG: 50S ribosomal protein L3 [Nanoarchaeota archaeon]|nr:50S ribosomal protein L3 [Nanoarchaeota archaeon]
MARLSRPRFGSLQFYPRKRVSKFLPSVNWSMIKVESPGILGLIAYKVGMASAIVKNTTDKAMTAGKRIAIPVTILEVPNMKVYSVRFYKNNQVLKEIVVSNDKELKRKIKVPKQVSNLDNVPSGYDDIRLIIYSLSKQTSIKKTPDLIEVAVKAENKLEFAKSLLNRELTIADFTKTSLVDVRGLTKGKGLQGPVKRFGITLKAHKSEKGRRRPGSLAPWHPARVTFRTPMAGQLGLFTRVHYNIKVITSGSIKDKDININSGYKHYGKLKTSYFVVNGSVQGPAKRQILLTPSFRPTKSQAKKKYEFIELVGDKK